MKEFTERFSWVIDTVSKYSCGRKANARTIANVYNMLIALGVISIEKTSNYIVFNVDGYFARLKINNGMFTAVLC